MIQNFQDSIFLITSSDSSNTSFGTGFAIYQNSGSLYVLTCAHVVRDVGSSDKVLVEGMFAESIASGEEEGIDLAVLKVEGLSKPSLAMEARGENGSTFVTAGFQKFDKDRLIRPLRGTLGDQVGLKSRKSGMTNQAWDLHIIDSHTLQPGYSGSPVVDEESGAVLAVISYRQGEGRQGLAISIDALEKIWKPVDVQQLYHTLLKLGYRQQVSLFRKLINVQSVAGFLIHGSQEYGQRWLLNRLVSRYVPFSLTGQVINLSLARKVRGKDASSLWRELSGRVGLRQKGSAPAEIAEKVHKWWQTQNVLIIFHDVDRITENSLGELISEFWVPLSNRIREDQSKLSKYKLLMFLVDYEGCTENWKVPLVEKLDLKGTPRFPVKSPRIEKFSQTELEEWVDNEYDELPSEITTMVEEVIASILEDSEGIPERVLEEICTYCGCNWYEVSERWLKL